MDNKIGKIIANVLVIIFVVSAVFLVITSLIMRFSHPEFTETQLMINHFKQYWYGYVVIIVLYFIHIWAKVRY